VDREGTLLGISETEGKLLGREEIEGASDGTKDIVGTGVASVIRCFIIAN